MQTLIQDLRYGARMLLKQPGFTLIAVLTLALGVSVNTAIFSVVNGVLLRPLPYPEPERIVRLFETVSRSAMPSDRMEVAPANYLDWQAQAQSFSGMAAYGFGELPLAGGGEAEVVQGAYVSHQLFSVLGVKPAPSGNRFGRLIPAWRLQRYKRCRRSRQPRSRSGASPSGCSRSSPPPHWSWRPWASMA
jgi:hypothetical protein